jgi:hypothetical protein
MLIPVVLVISLMMSSWSHKKSPTLLVWKLKTNAKGTFTVSVRMTIIPSRQCQQPTLAQLEERQTVIGNL